MARPENADCWVISARSALTISLQGIDFSRFSRYVVHTFQEISFGLSPWCTSLSEQFDIRSGSTVWLLPGGFSCAFSLKKLIQGDWKGFRPL
ncbi:MAG: hypothetical protein AAGH60_14110 [Pseudomonadota bacterium]